MPSEPGQTLPTSQDASSSGTEGPQEFLKGTLTRLNKAGLEGLPIPRLLERMLEISKEPKKALGHKAMDDLTAILSKLRDLLSNHRSARSYVVIGDIYFNIQWYRDALECYKKALTLDPKDKVTWNNAGVTMVRLGDYTGSVQYYNGALGLDQRYANAWFNKGKALNKALTAGPVGLSHRLKRALSPNSLRREALKCFIKATEFDPKNKSAWNNRGVILRNLNRHREAIKCYDKALELKNDYEWSWHNKGIALMDLKQFKEARKCFEQALIVNPDYIPAKKALEDLGKESVK